MRVFEINWEQCKGCLSCMNSCPAEAIRFKDGHVDINYDRCVGCAACYQNCGHGAIRRVSQMDLVYGFLKARRKVILAIDPACIAFLPNDVSIEKLAAAAQDLGVWDVADASEAAAAVASEYARLVQEKKMENIILTACPVTRNIIEHYYPDLIKYLAPVASPMIACGRMLKRDFTSAAVVYVSTCAARMEESQDVRHSTEINAVISIGELMEWFRQEGIDPAEYEEEPLLTDGGGLGESYAIAGGMLECVSHYAPSHDYQSLNVNGIPNCLTLMGEIREKKITGCVIEMNGCPGGCVGGCAGMEHTGEQRGRYAATLQIRNYIKNREKNLYFDTKGVAMANPALNRSVGPMEPGEADIQEMLFRMGVGNPRQQLNCGQCGYETCRDRALGILHRKDSVSICSPVVASMKLDLERAMLDNLPMAVVLIDDTQKIVSFNEEAGSLFNLKEEQETYIFEIMDPGDVQYVLDTGLPVKKRRFDIPELFLRAEANLVPLKDRGMVIGMFFDITEEEEEEAKQFEAKLQSVEMAQKVIEKQMTVAQQIAFLLGETTAETKVTLNKLKQRILDEGDEA